MHVELFICPDVLFTTKLAYDLAINANIFNMLGLIFALDRHSATIARDFSFWALFLVIDDIFALHKLLAILALDDCIFA